MFFALLSFAAAIVVGMAGYSLSRGFVGSKLRFVDAVNKPFVPILSGIGAAIVAMPIMALLPIVSTGTALTFGVAVWLGVKTGVKDIQRSIGPGI